MQQLVKGDQIPGRRPARHRPGRRRRSYLLTEQGWIRNRRTCRPGMAGSRQASTRSPPSSWRRSSPCWPPTPPAADSCTCPPSIWTSAAASPTPPPRRRTTPPIGSASCPAGSHRPSCPTRCRRRLRRRRRRARAAS
uniref:DNA binding protein n=1 Tax=Arundo donax TaxID=35708 RepID=A0A0A9CSE6_ARUDO